jgi:hypothetical protein
MVSENGQLVEVPITGGKYDARTNRYLYHLTDHTGNVRAVVARPAPSASFTSLTSPPGAASPAACRGYTGHQHLRPATTLSSAEVQGCRYAPQRIKTIVAPSPRRRHNRAEQAEHFPEYGFELFNTVQREAEGRRKK